MQGPRETALERVAPRLVAAAFLVIGLSYLAIGRQYPLTEHDQAGPGMYPLFVGVFWVIVAAVSLVEVLRHEAREIRSAEWPDRVGWARIATVLASAVAYVFLSPVFGDLVVGFVVLVAVMRAMGMRRWPVLIAIGAVMALVWHLVFVVALAVALPQGFWSR